MHITVVMKSCVNMVYICQMYKFIYKTINVQNTLPPIYGTINHRLNDETPAENK